MPMTASRLNPRQLLLNAVVDHHDQDPSPDYIELTVDGMAFSVTYDSSQPGAYHYTRLPGPPGGPAVGYGFTSRRSDHGRESTRAHEAAIRDFVAMVDPVTGYIEDADDDVDDV
jgi:hypothetical protein